MGIENRDRAFSFLNNLATEKGYVTFDNIMDCSDNYSLSIQEFDWLSNELSLHGVLIYDEEPTQTEVKEEQYEDHAQLDYEEIYIKIVEIDSSLKPFVDYVKNVIPPQRKEVSQLQLLIAEGNEFARERMICMHLRIALRLALNRYEMYGADLEETIGDACVGLITAVDKYEAEINGAFASYASLWITQNISRNQSTQNPLIYFPVHKKETYYEIYSYLDSIGYIYKNQICNKKEAYKLIEKKFKLSDECINEVYMMTEQICDSINCYLDEEYNDKDIPNQLITEFTCEDLAIRSTLKGCIEKILEQLKDKEREVIEKRYGLLDGTFRTLQEVSDEYDVTRERVRQIEAKAFRKIKSKRNIKLLIDYAEDFCDISDYIENVSEQSRCENSSSESVKVNPTQLLIDNNNKQNNILKSSYKTITEVRQVDISNEDNNKNDVDISSTNTITVDDKLLKKHVKLFEKYLKDEQFFERVIQNWMIDFEIMIHEIERISNINILEKMNDNIYHDVLENICYTSKVNQYKKILKYYIKCLKNNLLYEETIDENDNEDVINVAWEREELIILVTTYFKTKKFNSSNIKKAQEHISCFLKKRFEIITGKTAPEKFRNYAGIRLQSQRIKSLDPESTCKGMQGTYSQQLVVEEYLENPEKILFEAYKIYHKYI